MNRKTPAQKIKELEEERIKIEEELKQRKSAILKAKRRELSKINQQKRKEDTRKKILVGSAVLNKVENGDWPEEKLKKLMSNFLSRDIDRQLFKLTPHKKSPE